MGLKQHLRKVFIIVPLAGLTLFTSSYVDSYFEISKNLDIFISLYKELHLYYVDETQPGKLMEQGINGMLESLDPYTTFIPESDIEDYRFMTTGQYGGIGALIRKKGEHVMVAEPYEGFGADKAGLIAGDIILEINGKPTEGKSVEDVSSALKGQPKTEVKVRIQRPGTDKPFNKTIVREEVQIKSVPFSGMIDGEVGYVNLSSFTDNCSKDVADAIAELKGKGMKKLVLDLRGNPGGLLNEAVKLSNIFVDKDELIVSTKGKEKEWNKDYKAPSRPMEPEMPVAVLVNSGSASASEIVAGVLQDLDRGVVIGQRTFGKGLVQTTRPLSYNAQLKVTTAKYYIPSGRCIQAVNYAERNEDGSVSKVPDSLQTLFQTRGGRPVYDGGGILPDIELEPSRLSDIAFSLGSKFLLFDFATEFKLRNPSIPPASEFKVDDAMYAELKKWLADKEFDYTTESEQMIKELREAAEEDRYLDRIRAELDALEAKVTHSKAKDLETFSDQIRELLEGEIVARYHYQRGRIESMLRHDQEVARAVKLLNDPVAYREVLSVKK